MAKISFITGGIASGKTRWAISYFEACDNVLYLCVDDAMDSEIMDRIQFSNQTHKVEWDIQTGVQDLLAPLQHHPFVILDNLAAYVSRAMRTQCPDSAAMTDPQQHQIEQTCIDEICALMQAVKDMDGNLLIISIETGFSVCPQSEEQIRFRKILGAVNQRIANLSTDVYLSASGIQFKIRG